MAVPQTDVHNAYLGMGTDYEPDQLPNTLAQEIVGFTSARRGKMDLAHLIKTLQRQYGFTIYGTAIWLSEGGQGDRLLIYVHTGSNNRLYTIDLTAVYKYDQRLDGQHSYISLPALGSPLIDASGGVPIRVTSVQFAPSHELILSLDGVLYRYYVDTDGAGTEHLSALGILTPVAPTLSQTTGGSLTPLQTYQYTVTYSDEFFRESSPSAYASITLVSTNNEVGVTKPTSGATGGAIYWNIYRINPGNTTGVGNLVAEQIPFATTSFTDTLSDTVVDTGRAAPTAGENDPPTFADPILNPGTANILVVRDDRLILNSLEQLNQYQVSNAGSPTQFSSLPLPTNITDGIRVGVGGHGQNEVTGLFVYGSLLGVCGRETTSLMYGDDITNFTLRQTLDRGCQNPDSIQRCENQVMILSDDGIYTIQEGDGATDMKLSLSIENLFKGFISPGESGNPASPNNPVSIQVLNAITGNVNSFYSENRYYLSIGDKTICYDIQTGEWTNTGWGFIKTVSRYFSQMASYLVSAPETIFLTIASPTSNSTILKYFTVADTPKDFDAPSTFNSKIKYRPLLTGPDCMNHSKQAIRLAQYGRTAKPRGTVLGTLTWFVDGQSIRETPIYAYIVPDKASAGALFVCSAPPVQGKLVWAEANFTDTSLQLGTAAFELAVLN